MTPKEIVIRAIERAKADILFELEELELEELLEELLRLKHALD